MATQVQLRRGTSTENDSFTGATGELTYDTTNKRVRIHDGGTAGGFEIKTEDGSGNTIFADNEKAIFGAGSDLEIYHDGHSYIKDVGSGDLIIQASDDLLLESTSGDNYINCNNDGSVEVFYDGGIKLETTATGIDVTGTATMDGLTVESGTGNTALLGVSTDSGTEVLLADQVGGVSFKNVNGDIELRVNGAASTASSTRLAQKINENGDISFYEDTGTTPKLFWDASAESLQIGGTANIQAQGSNVTTFGNNFVLDGGYKYLTSGTANMLYFDAGGNTMFFKASSGTAGNAVSFSETMRIDSSGNVGIGESSPDELLHLKSNSSAYKMLKLEADTSGGDAGILLQGENGNQFEIHQPYDSAGLFFYDRTNNSERMRIDSSGRLLINNNTSQAVYENASAVNSTLQINNSEGSAMIARTTGSGRLFLTRNQSIIADSTLGEISFNGGDGTNLLQAAKIIGSVDSTPGSNDMPGRLQFYTTPDGTSSPTERMRIDSSGRLLVGKTSSSLSTVGVELNQNGTTFFTRSLPSGDGAGAVYMQRNTSDGNVLMFYDSTTSNVGSISTLSSTIAITGQGTASQTSGLAFVKSAVAPRVSPCQAGPTTVDNVIDLGHSSQRFDDIFATNGTIQTSDQQEKNTITDSDLGIDFIKRLTPKSYIFNGKTRTHYGLIAQDVETVLNDISKPTSGFAGFIKDDISEEQDGSEYRYGLRYTEFVAPLIQAVKDQQATIDALTARITALENGE